MKDYIEIQKHLNDLLDSLGHLSRLGVLTTKHSLTSQLGEFLVANLFDGELALNSTQKHWDVKIGDDKFIQVKTHAKSNSNKNRWTELKYSEDAVITELIIVVFTEDYKLKEFYKVPWNEAFAISVNKSRRIISWNKLNDYKQKIESLPKQELVQLFI